MAQPLIGKGEAGGRQRALHPSPEPPAQLTAGSVAFCTSVRCVKRSTSARARWLAGDSGRLANVVLVRWRAAPGGGAATAGGWWWAWCGWPCCCPYCA